MKNRPLARRAAALLILLAMLTVSVVSLIPITASADPVGDHASDIQDFGYQTLTNANQTDATTDLRVMFTIGSLDYDAVGFVFSTSDSAPTAGGSNTYSTTTVHSTINAGGDAIPAGPSRFWVAVKLSTIPLASFETPIYIRPFVRVGENYSYIDAAAITVCEALTYDKTVAGEKAIFNSKDPSGDYLSGSDFKVSKTIGEIRGEKHFFKTEADPNWNNLYFEYSLLWNETLANSYNSLMSVAKFDGLWGSCDMYRFYTRDDVDAERSAGTFDLYMTGLWGHSTSAVYEGPKTVEEYPALSNRYGWHRIGVLFDYSVLSTTNTRAQADAHGVEYYCECLLYVDGSLVWRYRANIQGNWSSNQWKNKDGFRPNGSVPFMATSLSTKLQSSPFKDAETVEYDGAWYVDLDDVSVNMTIPGITESENAVYVAISDVHWSCGGGFVRNVSPVADPVDRTIVLDDKGTADPSDDVTCSGKIWYVFDN